MPKNTDTEEITWDSKVVNIFQVFQKVCNSMYWIVQRAPSHLVIFTSKVFHTPEYSLEQRGKLDVSGRSRTANEIYCPTIACIYVTPIRTKKCTCRAMSQQDLQLKNSTKVLTQMASRRETIADVLLLGHPIKYSSANSGPLMLLATCMQ